MKYKREKEMYFQVCNWLEKFLTDRFRGANIDVYELSGQSLTRFISTQGIEGFDPEWVTWDIRVDVVGFIRFKRTTSLAFVECKNVHLTLAHLSQLLGYSRIALPICSFLISPLGLSSALSSLLQEYQRLDVLEYHWEKGKMPRKIAVAKWDSDTRNIDIRSLIGGTIG